jgi:hypothetical protein
MSLLIDRLADFSGSLSGILRSCIGIAGGTGVDCIV